MKIIIYDTVNNKLETYYRELYEYMPYAKNRWLSVKEFRGSSSSNILWTTKQAIEAFNTTRQKWGKGIYVGYCFKRIWEGGHSRQSQHYAGLAFDCAQNISYTKRKELYNLARKLGVWKYIEPISMTPTWLHFDRRYGTPACNAGYPSLSRGSKGVYVLILQDALSTLGYSIGGLDGIFGAKTYNAVRSFQQSSGLPTTGTCACLTWNALIDRVLAKGKTNTTILY
jgi:hypothetical protein